MFDVTTIPMKQFSLQWRLTDPKYRVLPQVHLEQIKPLDEGSAKRLFDFTQPWFNELPFTQGYFTNVASMPTNVQSDQEIRLVRKWLYQREVPFQRRVLLSWNGTVAAMSTWKIVVKYWDELWYPGSDDLVVFDDSLSWALFLFHEEVAFFAKHPVQANRPRT